MGPTAVRRAERNSDAESGSSDEAVVARVHRWLDDERFKTPALRDLNADERLNMTQQALLEKTAEEWIHILDEAGVPSAPVLKRKEVIEHPQILARDLLLESDHPEAGRIRQTRPAARFSVSQPEMRSGAPVLGAHTKEVLKELNLSDEEIESLIASGAVATAP